MTLHIFENFGFSAFVLGKDIPHVTGHCPDWAVSGWRGTKSQL